MRWFLSILALTPSRVRHNLCYFSQDESFLEDVNMMLNTGDIPNLYENEERLEIIEKVGQL